jgi:hypothetical protein
MYLYHVLFILINIYGVDCQKKGIEILPRVLVFGKSNLTNFGQVLNLFLHLLLN